MFLTSCQLTASRSVLINLFHITQSKAGINTQTEKPGFVGQARHNAVVVFFEFFLMVQPVISVIFNFIVIVVDATRNHRTNTKHQISKAIVIEMLLENDRQVNEHKVVLIVAWNRVIVGFVAVDMAGKTEH